MHKEKLDKIVFLNEFLDKHLNLQNLKKSFSWKVIYKIVFTNLLRYGKNFYVWNKIDTNKYENYIKAITDFVYENIYLKEKLEKSDILKLHYFIMKDLSLEKYNVLWDFRTWAMTIHWYDTRWKLVAIYPVKVKYIKIRFEEELNKLNKNLWKKKKSNLLAIIEFIFNMINEIHPFENWNWKVFFVLFDILLFKYDFFPVFILKEEHRKKLFNNVISHYVENKKKEVYLNYFLDLIIEIYSNYKM